jgi:hypothetical protein
VQQEKASRNADLWDQILKLIEFHDVSVEWVEGHAGHPENERCDFLARAAATGKDLLPDVGYEQSGVEPSSRYADGAASARFTCGNILSKYSGDYRRGSCHPWSCGWRAYNAQDR